MLSCLSEHEIITLQTYQDFGYSEGPIMLGHIDSGMDIISGMDEDFSITLEKFGYRFFLDS